LQIHALVDFDPDGLAIMSVFKHGSAALAHDSHHLITPAIRWLGLNSEAIREFHQDTDKAWLRMTARDRRLAMRMLERPVFQDSWEPVCRRELQVMLILNIKAEIQILGQCADVERYLSPKLYRPAFSSDEDVETASNLQNMSKVFGTH
jgi:meiotic recombination protein SPO11